MRFEWLVLLAYTRRTESSEGGWVSVEQIQQLPLWRGKDRAHVGTNIGRYVRNLTVACPGIVETRSDWRGPYRLRLSPSDILFDVPIESIAEHLKITRSRSVLKRETMLLFTEKYSKATALLFRGRLAHTSGTTRRQQKNALKEFSEIANDLTFGPWIHVLANLSGARVLDYLGKLSAAAKTLEDCESIITQVSDPAIKARYHLAQGWRYARMGDYEAAQKEIDNSMMLATATTDLSLIGTTEDRTGVQLSMAGVHADFSRDFPLSREKYNAALDHLLRGLKARLIVDNYDAIHTSCFNIGNTLHRMGEKHYAEAKRWLVLSVEICTSMRLGGYEAGGEVILAKMALENGKTAEFVRWIDRAEQMARQANNAIDLCTVYIVRAIYCNKHDKEQEAIENLVKARQIYADKVDYDRGTRDWYLSLKFPKLWSEVIKRFPGESSIRPVQKTHTIGRR